MLDTPPALIAPAPVPIIVTASRVPETIPQTVASVSVVDTLQIERSGLPLVSDYLRLLPSTSVSVSGPAGSLTEVRIRGAEANHTLLFIDGIRANDPAAGNVPRFELLNADIASRIELVRGPQSALWGSEAIGGVIAVSGDPAAGSSVTLMAEGGSFGTARGAASASYAADDVKAAVGFAAQKARGTDSFNGAGDKDGFENESLRGMAEWASPSGLRVGASGFALAGISDFDGYSPITFAHADTLDSSRNRLGAFRGWVATGTNDQPLSGTLSLGLLGSSNINRLAQVETNRTTARRATAGGEVRGHFVALGIEQHLVGAIEEQDERFHARDASYGGGTNQDRSRRNRSVTAEWKGEWQALTGDFALRRDAFNRFRDATTVRASLLARLGSGLEATASYGEGIAQPTFFDLYGFFPGSFAGNPKLVPERSRGFETSLRWRGDSWSSSLTVYRQRLRSEIVSTYDSTTFLSGTANAVGTSRRQGVEIEGGWSPSPRLRLRMQGAFLDATQPEVAGLQLKEVRRPRWSGSVSADGEAGRLNYGASIALVGRHSDVDFDQFPAATVNLGGYALASARIGWQMTRSVELFARVANAFDRHYIDVIGYRPSGRSINGGLRLAIGR